MKRIVLLPLSFQPLLALVALGACMAQPPRTVVHASEGRVRGASHAEAERVGDLLDHLAPQVLGLLPQSELPEDLEVWIQDTPHLYSFPTHGVADAEGLWSDHHHRILLARGADDLERTLAHELVHAALDEGWDHLPGTLEEGLCDAISARLVPEGAARLRAGRLSSAALTCGGLRLELRLGFENSGREWIARVSLSGEDAGPEPQSQVFEVEAGLSSTSLTSGAKRGYYGLAFLLVERIVERRGLEGLQDLCHASAQQGFPRVPRAWLLEAAELADDAEAWRAAAVGAMGPAELEELVRMYPDFAADALASWLRDEDLSAGWPAGLTASLSLEGGAEVQLTELPFVLEEVRARR